MHILVAIDPQIYSEALVYTLYERRPACEVLRVAPEDLDSELEHLNPGLVICNEATNKVQALAPSWIALHYSNRINATVCVGGHQFAREGVTIEDVLAIVDEAERSSAAGLRCTL